mmetsp:Transcript_67773/g.113563  ORF Transcript_67773/g.113563 Transcript_67773/m.113563 type:complete len:83 (+) Transcript_67773:285-533(+)
MNTQWVTNAPRKEEDKRMGLGAPRDNIDDGVESTPGKHTGDCVTACKFSITASQKVQNPTIPGTCCRQDGGQRKETENNGGI